jgi:hypothetical protein
MSAFKATLLVACLWLASCTSPIPQRAEDLKQKAVCCESFEQMQFAPLPLDRDTSVRMDAATSVFAFTNGKSYFQAFKLPADVRGRDLEIVTYIGGTTKFDSSVFYPQLLVLDEPHRVRGSVPVPGVRYKLNYLSGATWRTRLSFEPGDTYLIVYTSPGLVGYGLLSPGSSGHGGMVGNVPYYSPGSPMHLVPIGPTGNLMLRWVSSDTTRSTIEPPKTFPPLEDRSMSLLTGSIQERTLIDWDGFQVVAVDKASVRYGSADSRFNMPIQVAPGAHKPMVIFRTTKGYAGEDFPDAVMELSGDFEAGHRYCVVGTIEGSMVTAWIQSDEGRRTSEPVTSSMYWQKPLRMQ